MSTINLLTIHFGESYGAVMQTYATCKLLELHGHKVNVINLLPLREKKHRITIRTLIGKYREMQFNSFKNRYFPNLTKKMNTIEQNKLPDADCTVVGSDQVWNKDITGKFNLSFYLDFLPANHKRYSFSSSFGKEQWLESEDYTKEVLNALARFQAISVREQSGIDILKSKFNLEAISLIDPTIAYGKFDDLVYNSRPINKIYTFLFKFDRSTQLIVNEISKALNTEVFKPNAFINRFFNGPRHWLTRLKNSKYIITDSFHGLALSLIFKKEVFVLCADPSKFTRLFSLLRLTNLTRRYITSKEDFLKRMNEILQPIDYTKVDTILSKERTRSHSFLNIIK